MAEPLIQKEDIPILILINKIDIIGIDSKKINTIYNGINYSLLNRKRFLVKDISALKNIRLEESIRWLFNTITDNEKIEENEGNNIIKYSNYLNLV